MLFRVVAQIFGGVDMVYSLYSKLNFNQIFFLFHWTDYRASSSEALSSFTFFISIFLAECVA